MKAAVNILKETLTDVLFYFANETLTICGSDPEKVSISKIVVHLPTLQLNGPDHSVTVAVCLQDINKFLRGAEKKDGLIITVENDHQLAFRLVSANADRNSWFKFAKLEMAKDRIIYDAPSPTIQMEFSSRLIQRSLKEVVHGHDVVTVKVVPKMGLRFTTYSPTLGGGKTTLYPDPEKLPDQEIQGVYLVRYILKLLRVLPATSVTLQLTEDHQPLVLQFQVDDACHGLMALAPQTEE